MRDACHRSRSPAEAPCLTDATLAADDDGNQRVMVDAGRIAILIGSRVSVNVWCHVSGQHGVAFRGWYGWSMGNG